MRKWCIIIVTLAATALTGAARLDREFERQLKSQLQLEHVYDRFSEDRGPGTILRRADNDEYVMTVNARAAVDMPKTQYDAVIARSLLPDFAFGGTRVIETAIGIDVPSTSTATLKSVRVRLILSNGTRCTLAKAGALSRIFRTVSVPGGTRQDLLAIKARRPQDHFFVLQEVYAYDYAYLCKWEGVWRSLTRLPPKVFAQVAPQVGVVGTSTTSFRSEGKGFFIGFDSLIVKKEERREEGTPEMAASIEEGLRDIAELESWQAQPGYVAPGAGEQKQPLKLYPRPRVRQDSNVRPNLIDITSMIKP